MADIYNCQVGFCYNCQVGFWQRQFLGKLFRAVFSLRGRVNLTNLARFSSLHEQTFRGHFQKAFRWAWFNLTVFRLRRHPEEPIIGVFDCSFLPKSGTETWGIGRFFSSLAGRPKQGLLTRGPWNRCDWKPQGFWCRRYANASGSLKKRSGRILPSRLLP